MKRKYLIPDVEVFSLNTSDVLSASDVDRKDYVGNDREDWFE